MGPARSLLAYLTPAASPVLYWKEPEAGAARPRREAGVASWGLKARVAWRARECRSTMVDLKQREGNGRAWGRLRWERKDGLKLLLQPVRFHWSGRWSR